MVEISSYIRQLGEQARSAAAVLARTPTARKNDALHAFAAELRRAQDLLLAANEQDLRNATHLAAPLRERLDFGGARGITAMAESAEAVAALPDPVGEITNLVYRPSGIQVGHMRMPLGVIAIIYESRPNVTVEAATLCLKSGNAAILRGGSESLLSNQAIAACLAKALAATGLHPHSVQVMDQTDRALVGQLVQLRGLIDLIIPRGGRALLERLQKESTIPLLMHLDGNCHVYVDESADLAMASKVVVNAKTQRLSTCNTLESLLVAQDVAATFLPTVAQSLSAMSIELRCCPQSFALLKGCGAKVVVASEEDWYAEYLAPILSIKVIANLDQAIAHINRYSSHHTDAIITKNLDHAQRFLREVDSSSVMVNASTRFADGFEYGLGAEIGISTDKLHARGPVGLTGLTSKKWVVLGDGHIRE